MEKKDLFIVVGSDGSGKTTLVEQLYRLTRYKTKHFSAPKSYEEAKNDYFTFAITNEENYICDRFYEGEVIFAPLYRGYTADYFDKLEEVLKEKYNVILILAYAPFNVIEKRLFERGEEFVKQEHFQYCYDKVVDFFNSSTLPKMIVDTNQASPYHCAVTIISNFYKFYPKGLQKRITVV